MKTLQTVLAWLGLVVMFGVVAVYYPGLPAKIPVHFDANNAVDGWGSRYTVLLWPAIGLALFVLMTLARRIPNRYVAVSKMNPTAGDIEIAGAKAREISGLARALLVWIFAGETIFTIAEAHGHALVVGEMVFAGVMVFIALGIVGHYTWQMMREPS